MDKLDVYRQALLVFGYQATITEEDLEAEDKSGHPEIQTLDLMYQTALEMVMRERAWSFLETKLDLGKDLGPEPGYEHSYALPAGLFRVTWADGVHRVAGGRLLTNGEAVAYGQMLEVPDSGVPAGFTTLVAYALAILASAKLSPGDQKAGLASSLYQRMLQTMMLSDIYGQSRDVRGNTSDGTPYIQ